MISISKIRFRLLSGALPVVWLLTCGSTVSAAVTVKDYTERLVRAEAALDELIDGEPSARQNDLNGWIEPFRPIFDGLAIVLRLLRDNGRASHQTAYRGVFQLMLTTSKVAQLLRLTVPLDLPCVPEISANKYALNVRFTTQEGMQRPRPADTDVEFELIFCNL